MTTLPVLEAELLDPARRVADAEDVADDERVVGEAVDVDDEVVAVAAEAQHLRRDQRPEHEPVVAAGVGNRVGAVAERPAVGVVAEPAGQLVGAAAAVEHVGAVVEALQQVGARRAAQHRELDLGERPDRAVGEVEALDEALVEAVDDAQLVARVGEREQQVAAVAPHAERIGVDERAEHDGVDGARELLAVQHLGDRVEVVAEAEQVGVGRAPAEELVVALAAVEDVVAVDDAVDDVVAAPAAGDGEDLLDVLDAPEGAVVELELLDAGELRAELVSTLR